MSTSIASIYRYPVKGLSPEPLESVSLTAGSYFPGDRVFAVENGPSGFQPSDPQHQPKIKFLMLMRNEILSRLKTRYVDDTSTLVIEDGGRVVAQGDMSKDEGRLAIETFFREFMPEELRGAPKVLEAPRGFRFTDFLRGHVSFINLASVRDLERVVGAPLDPLRFRGNIHLEGLPAWEEFKWVGKTVVTASGVRLKITKRIQRCAATNVEPGTGLRDQQIPKTLMDAYGHMDCGIYAEVIAGGAVVPGDTLAVEQAELAF
jgi:uncharacterized protein YcbX